MKPTKDQFNGWKQIVIFVNLCSKILFHTKCCHGTLQILHYHFICNQKETIQFINNMKFLSYTVAATCVLN